MDLDGRSFGVWSTANAGVVSRETVLDFKQRGDRVLGRYRGGTIRRGVLVGRVARHSLTFRYAQREQDGAIHGGHSTCEIQRDPQGRLTIVEHFTWETRTETGTNVFVER